MFSFILNIVFQQYFRMKMKIDRLILIDLYVIRHYICQSFEIHSSYSQIFEMKIVHNTTLNIQSYRNQDIYHVVFKIDFINIESKERY